MKNRILRKLCQGVLWSLFAFTAVSAVTLMPGRLEALPDRMADWAPTAYSSNTAAAEVTASAYATHTAAGVITRIELRLVGGATKARYYWTSRTVGSSVVTSSSGFLVASQIHKIALDGYALDPQIIITSMPVGGEILVDMLGVTPRY